MQKDEIWKPIPSMSGYQISNMGRVKGLKGNIIKGFVYKGYRLISCQRKGSLRNPKVHRLVMETFVGPSNLEVDHINGIKDDNRLENLRYVTSKQNADNRKRLNGYKSGLKSQNAKLNLDQVLRVLNEYKISSNEQVIKKFSLEYKVSKYTIRNIIRGKGYRDVYEVWSRLNDKG